MGKYITLTEDLPRELHAAHPICILKKIVEMGYSPLEAPREARIKAAAECILEDKLHGIWKLIHAREIEELKKKVREEYLGAPTPPTPRRRRR